MSPTTAALPHLGFARAAASNISRLLQGCAPAPRRASTRELSWPQKTPARKATLHQRGPGSAPHASRSTREAYHASRSLESLFVAYLCLIYEFSFGRSVCCIAPSGVVESWGWSEGKNWRGKGHQPALCSCDARHTNTAVFQKRQRCRVHGVRDHCSAGHEHGRVRHAAFGSYR